MSSRIANLPEAPTHALRMIDNWSALAARLGNPNLSAKMLGNAGSQALDCSER